MQKVEYMMKYSDKELGKKVALADIIHGACFALEAYKSYPDPNDPSRGAIDVYTDYLKNRRDWNYNLLPTMAVSATCNIIPEDKIKYFGPPTPDEIRMLNWLNIIYGTKGMNWYPYLGYLPAENFATMGEFSQQVQELTPVILGPEEVTGIYVTDNANVKGKNVKTMIRETDDAYYLFTVRLTEREWWDDPSVEPEQISAAFDIAGLPGNVTATEYLNHKKVFEEHGTTAGGTEFTFTLAQKPVPGSVSFVGVKERRDTPYKKYCYVFDDGKGNLYANKYWKAGGTTPAGTIDYATGEVTVYFPNMWNQKKEQILPGEDGVTASYEPVRTERTVTIQDGSFTDTFMRNDVHIYRIPKN